MPSVATNMMPKHANACARGARSASSGSACGHRRAPVSVSVRTWIFDAPP